MNRPASAPAAGVHFKSPISDLLLFFWLEALRSGNWMPCASVPRSRSICPMTTAGSEIPPSAALVRTKRFWNWKLIGIEIVVTAFGFFEFRSSASWLLGMAGIGIGVLGVWLLAQEFRGVAINAQIIALKAADTPSSRSSLVGGLELTLKICGKLQ